MKYSLFYSLPRLESSLQYLNLPERNLESIDPKIDKHLYESTALLISALDERREKRRYGGNIVHSHISSVRCAVLVFLPGVGEIETMHKHLLDYENNAVQKNYWHVLPLHSRITSEEQSRVFQPISSLPQHMKHYRKIILSTNIAESSLTVPDITYVIDFCLVKQLVTDPETNFCSLKVLISVERNLLSEFFQKIFRRRTGPPKVAAFNVKAE